MSMPTSALACTQVYMGNKLTADGNTYYGRAEDYRKRYLKHFGIEPSFGPGHTYSSDGVYLDQDLVSLHLCA